MRELVQLLGPDLDIAIGLALTANIVESVGIAPRKMKQTVNAPVLNKFAFGDTQGMDHLKGD